MIISVFLFIFAFVTLYLLQDTITEYLSNGKSFLPNEMKQFMAYSQEKKDECFDYIVSEIESGKSLRYALNTNGMPSSKTFYEWLEEKDEKGNLTIEAQEKVKRYACACELRESIIFDEILEIADKQGEDVIETDNGTITNHNIIQRNKLQIEARQWVLGRLNAPKYGNRVQTEHSGEVKTTTTVIKWGDNEVPI